MLIQSQAIGEIEIDPSQIFHFPFGLYAFEDLRSFALVDSAYPPFYWLQSLEHEELAFLLVAPRFLIVDYSVAEAALEDFSSIGITGTDDPNLLTFAIVTLSDRDSTANMQGPLLLNKNQHLGRQVIVSSFSLHHSLLGLYHETALNPNSEIDSRANSQGL